ncbi:glycosyltransferase family 4 protein [Clostridium sp.]|uniref:glycosyltransferase family 4 protein n=1 Tax=Clostridium sp. TaxID=1506 RepID=UPI00399685EC
MRIIILSSNMTDTGGIQRLTATLANSFIKKSDIDVHIINTGLKKGKERFYIDDRIENIYMNIEPQNLFGLNIIQKLVDNMKTFYKIKRFFKDYSFSNDKNIVIALGHSQSCLLPYVIPKEDNINIIGSQHNPISYNLIYSIIRQISLKKLDKYILLNETMQEDFLKHYNFGNTCIIENPNRINGKKSDLNNKIVIAVGRMTEQKNFETLINMWSDIKEKNINWTLRIIGDGPLREELLNQIKKLNLEDVIELKSFNSNIENEYYKADILAMTSIYEGFGLVLVEAQSCGIPTIAFDCPTGPRNIINDGIDGYLIENGDAKQFIKKLDDLMNNNEMRWKMGDNAFENSKRFDVETITEKWIKLFNEI